jgi:hypothetical protein
MYIDPNTGGVLFQALAGVLAFFTTMMLVFSKNIRHYFSRLRRSTRKDEEDNDQISS